MALAPTQTTGTATAPKKVETKPNPALFPTVPKADKNEDSTAKASGDFNTFLTLLTAQLRNQDPTNPLDATQFVAQLASFSTVEQVIGTNSRLDALSAQSAVDGVAAFSGWIGRQVASTDGSFRSTGGAQGFAVPVVANAERVEGIVTDKTGKVVDKFTVAADAAGNAVWPGNGTRGDLTLTLSYLADNAELARQSALVFRTVTGIRGSADGAVLDLADGATLAPANVTQLREAPAANN